MKKILSIIIVSILAISLVACGGAGGGSGSSSAKTIEEAQKIWEGLGYTVSTIPESELGFDVASAQKGIQILDYDNKLIAVAYFEFASKEEVVDVVNSFKNLQESDGAIIEEVNDNLFKLKSDENTVSMYVAHNDKYFYLALPFGDESIAALDELSKEMGFTS